MSAGPRLTVNLPPVTSPPATRSSTQARALPARNFGQSRFSTSTDIGLITPATRTSSAPGVSTTLPASSIEALPERITNREIVTRPSCGVMLPATCHSSTFMGVSPNSSMASTAGSALRVKFQDCATP